MPKVSEEYGQAQRQRILDAAAVCFARNGFRSTTTDDICNKAGVSAGTLYHYFSSKEEIIAETAAGVWSNRRKAWSEALEQKPSSTEALKTVMGDFFQLRRDIELHPEMRLAVQLWAEASLNPKLNSLLLAHRKELLELLSKIIQRGQEKNEFNPNVDPLTMAGLFHAVLIGVQIYKITQPDLNIDKYETLWKDLIESLLSRGGPRAKSARIFGTVMG